MWRIASICVPMQQTVRDIFKKFISRDIVVQFTAVKNTGKKQVLCKTKFYSCVQGTSSDHFRPTLCIKIFFIPMKKIHNLVNRMNMKWFFQTWSSLNMPMTKKWVQWVPKISNRLWAEPSTMLRTGTVIELWDKKAHSETFDSLFLQTLKFIDCSLFFVYGVAKDLHELLNHTRSCAGEWRILFKKIILFKKRISSFRKTSSTTGKLVSFAKIDCSTRTNVC